MTDMKSTDWHPEQDLTALLDALTDELLITSDREAAAVLNATADQSRAMVQEVRRLVAAAEIGLIVPSNAEFISQNLRDYVTKRQ